jgi:hypothetical protein
MPVLAGPRGGLVQEDLVDLEGANSFGPKGKEGVPKQYGVLGRFDETIRVISICIQDPTFPPLTKRGFSSPFESKLVWMASALITSPFIDVGSL